MYYYSFNNYLKERFGGKVRRISLNAGLTCPNRDGTLNTEGCVFCNESAFSRFPEKTVSLKEQIESSIVSGKNKFGIKKFIAYFQNAAGTNAEPKKLKSVYDTIRDYPEIVGLFISTRPDCINEEKLDLIGSYVNDYEVWIEYGVQTSNNKTLKSINRGHTFLQSVRAIERTASRGIKVGAHIILGLPDETMEDMVLTARKISNLAVSGVKLHVLHAVKDTKLADLYSKGLINLLNQEEYVNAVCSFLENLRADCVILRLVSDAKKDYLIAPEWINDKQLVIRRIEEEFKRRGTRQGVKTVVSHKS